MKSIMRSPKLLLILVVLAIALSLVIHPTHFGLWGNEEKTVFSRTAVYKPWLEQIQKNKIVPVGFVPWHFPFSYRENSGKGKGFSVEFTEKLVQALGEELGIPNLTTKWEPMKIADSPGFPYPALAERKVAFECNTTLALEDHPKAVILTDPFFVSGVHILSNKNRAVHSIEDIRGKSILGQEGVFQRWAEHRLNQELGLSVGIIPYPILQYATVLAQENQAYAIAGDALRLFSLSYALPFNGIENWVASTHLGEVGYSCSLLSSEPELQTALNNAIAKVLADDAYQRLYHRWFLQETPFSKIRLNYPMPKGLQQLITQQGATINPEWVGVNFVPPALPK